MGLPPESEFDFIIDSLFEKVKCKFIWTARAERSIIGAIERTAFGREERKEVMLKVWGKLIRGHRIVKSLTAEDPNEGEQLLSRVRNCLDRIIMEFDLPRPIWLKQNEREILEFGLTSFFPDHFIEPVSFHHLEIEIIENEEQSS